MMSGSIHARGAHAYARLGLETSINSASPEKLISLLFEGARTAIARARFAFEQKDIPARGQAISKAIGIVSEGLRAALNLEAGGEIAANLQELYIYIERCLLQANLNADVSKLDEADRLLADIASAWNEMEPTKGA